jgi:hypothetical protein
VIDIGFAIYGLLLAAMIGLALVADARRRARRRLAETADISRKF